MASTVAASAAAFGKLKMIVGAPRATSPAFATISTPARVSVIGADGRVYAPVHAWTHLGEFDRNETPFESRYFHTGGEERIEVPAGRVQVHVMKGL